MRNLLREALKTLAANHKFRWKIRGKEGWKGSFLVNTRLFWVDISQVENENERKFYQMTFYPARKITRYDSELVAGVVNQLNMAIMTFLRHNREVKAIELGSNLRIFRKGFREIAKMIIQSMGFTLDISESGNGWLFLQKGVSMKEGSILSGISPVLLFDVEQMWDDFER